MRKKGDIFSRKEEHLRISLEESSQWRASSLLDNVFLLHSALPDADFSKISTKVRVFGKELQVPLIIPGMTGGTALAGRFNRALSEVCEEKGIAFGVGSERILLKHAKTARTFQVRDLAPNALLFGNLGLANFCNGNLSPKDARLAVETIGADGLFLHLNPAQEIVQPGGDTDFSKGFDRIAEICDELGSIPVLAKETGCGISSTTAKRLIDAGIAGIDVSGVGGTSWIAIELARSRSKVPGVALSEASWGIPTAASIAFCSGLGVPVIASGGVRSGVDVARSISLGASLAGFAQPVFHAYSLEGTHGISAFLDARIAELRAAMFLTGSSSIKGLASAEKRIVGPLRDWLLEDA